MKDRYLYRAKRKNWRELPKERWWVEGYYARLEAQERDVILVDAGGILFLDIDQSTICQCTELKDKNGKLIWENDILMCHGNPKDLVKAVFGEFTVINAETLEKIDNVIGWHYEVIPTDALSKCEPFCLSMPLNEQYVKTCEFEVICNIFDNPELLEVGE